MQDQGAVLMLWLLDHVPRLLEGQLEREMEGQRAEAWVMLQSVEVLVQALVLVHMRG
jgi:hypothetical protein